MALRSAGGTSTNPKGRDNADSSGRRQPQKAGEHGWTNGKLRRLDAYSCDVHRCNLMIIYIYVVRSIVTGWPAQCAKYLSSIAGGGAVKQCYCIRHGTLIDSGRYLYPLLVLYTTSALRHESVCAYSLDVARPCREGLPIGRPPCEQTQHAFRIDAAPTPLHNALRRRNTAR